MGWTVLCSGSLDIWDLKHGHEHEHAGFLCEVEGTHRACVGGTKAEVLMEELGFDMLAWGGCVGSV